VAPEPESEIANETEAVQDGRIYIEKINEPFLFRDGGSPAEYGSGLAYAIGWLWKHESGTYVKFTQAGADLFVLMPSSSPFDDLSNTGTATPYVRCRT
jgi:hypothetical protein